MLAAATRLHLRSIEFLDPFLAQVSQIMAQIDSTPGCAGVELRRSKGLAFWTMSIWDDKKSLLAFSQSGAHKEGMPLLAEWCDEAVHVHWDFHGNALPSWQEAEVALINSGQLAKLTFPSETHKAGEVCIS